MVYVKQTWADDTSGGTAVTAARLNHMETGIKGSAEVVVAWDTSDWDRFDEYLISQATVTSWTKTVVTDTSNSASNVVSARGRLTGPGTGTQGDTTRIFHVIDDTDCADSEITTLLYSRSDHDVSGAGGQMGHVHRGGINGATGRPWGYVIWYDIVSQIDYIWNIGLWTTDGASPPSLVSPVGTSSNGQRWLVGGRYKSMIYDSGRTSNTVTLYIEYGHPLQVGDTINVTGTNAFDTFFIGARTLTAVTSSTVQYTLSGSDVTAGLAGSYGVLGNTRRTYPLWLKTRMVGNVIWAKVWRYGTTEPDWQQNDQAFRWVDSNNQGPTTGKCGVVVSHLIQDKYVELGSITVKPLG